MEKKRDLAVILRAIPFEERHQIVTALTERNGLVSALARNSIQSRRFGGTLEPFAASEWMFVEKPAAELWRLDEATIRRAYGGLRKDFDRLSMAAVLSEFMIRVAPRNEPCPDLFRLHCNALAALEELEPDQKAGTTFWRAILNGYLAKILQWHGHQPQLESCLGCSTSIDALAPDARVSAIVTDAAWICPSCRAGETRHVRDRGSEGFASRQLRLSPAAIQDFKICLAMPVKRIPELVSGTPGDREELFRFIEALFVYHLPGFDQQPLKSLKFVQLESSVGEAGRFT
jgi:DNA repair protein RecO